MKKLFILKGIFLFPLFLAMGLAAQQKISVDLGAVRQKNYHNGGLTVSSYYHFSERLLGGMGVNRFFPVHRIVNGEEELLSGWDIEMNVHYLFPIRKGLKFFPITGISHTSEKELIETQHENHYERFWSVNTGAGISLELHKWLPYFEYNFSWGRINQQFLLVGIGYEIDWKGRH